VPALAATQALTAGEALETAGVMGGQIAGVTGTVRQASFMGSSLCLEDQNKCLSAFIL